MTTIAKQNGFKIEFNGSSTYFITDENGDVWGRKDTERKAKNLFKKVLQTQGVA